MMRASLLAAVLCLGAVLANAQTAFYDATPQQIAGAPGTLIRQQAMARHPRGADAYLMLYRSTGLDGRPIAVSGVVVVPWGPAPSGGRPIVAWAHPTTGIVPRCAPSLAIFLFQQMMGLRPMIERGYVVVATDYPGLGTPGPHPYLVGVSEGRAVLDSVRAARNLLGAGVNNRVALWGHSQGGQAVLYAAEIAKQYAPELNLAGVAAAAPATEFGTLLRDDFATPGGKNLLAMTLWSWSQVFGAPLAPVVEPAAMPTIDRLAHVCLESPIDIPSRRAAGRALQQHFLSVPDLTGMEPWRSLLANNTVGTLPPATPVLLAQGASDDTVEPAVTQRYMQRLCAAGSAVRMLTLPDVGHGLIAADAADTVVAWISQRFAAAPPPSDCGR